jgi:hypothetical protein
MNNDEILRRWTLIDMNALSEISMTTTFPGVYELSKKAIPIAIQQMPGTVSCFVSTYSNPKNIGNNTVVGAELAVVRADKGMWKAYNFAIASSDNGYSYFNGPYKNFPTHHMASTSSVSLGDLFGHTPYST